MVSQVERDEVHSVMKVPSRAFSALVLITFLCMFNQTFVVPSIKEIVIDRFDASTTEASLFVSVEMVAYIIFAIVWGTVSDRSGRRKDLIVIGLLGSSGLYFAMSLADSLAMLLALRFAQGAFTVMAWSLVMTMALDITDKKEYGASMGVLGTGLALGLGLGSPIGGIAGDYGALVPLYVASATYLATALLAVVLISDLPTTRTRGSLRRALSRAAEDRRIVAPYIFSFAERFSSGYFVILLPLYMAHEFDAAPSERGMFMGAFLLAFAFLQYPFGKLSDKHGRRWMLVGGGAAYACLFGVLGTLDEASLLVAMIACGALAAMLFPASVAVLADLCSRQERATLMGGFNALGSLGFAIAPIMAAVLAEEFGYAESFLSGGGVIVLCVLCAVPFLRKTTVGPKGEECVPTPAERNL